MPVESLESRRLLSVSVAAKKAALNITGTSGDDVIVVAAHRNLINIVTVSITSANGVENSLVAVGRFRTINIYGGDGNDELRMDKSLSGLAGDVTAWIDGGNGDDFVSDASLPGTIALRDGDDRVKLDAREPLRIFGDAGDDQIEVKAGAHLIEGDAGNDSITVGDGAFSIRGGGGDDRITAGRNFKRLEGNEGDDVIRASSGQTERLYAGDGNDLVTILTTNLTNPGKGLEAFGGAGNDTMQGSGDFDILHGDDGADILVAGAGSRSDELHGGAGNDVLDASGTANATLFGGEGDDDLYAGSATTGKGESGKDWFSNDTGWLSKDEDKSDVRAGGVRNIVSYGSASMSIDTFGRGALTISGGALGLGTSYYLKPLDGLGYVVASGNLAGGRIVGTQSSFTVIGAPQFDPRVAVSLTTAERKAVRNGIVRLPEGWKLDNARKKQGDFVWYDIRFGKGGDRAKTTEFATVFQLCVKVGTVIVTADAEFTSKPGRIARARSDAAAMWLSAGATARVAGEAATYRLSDRVPETLIKAPARQRGILVDGGVIWLPFESKGTRFESIA